MKVKSLSRVRLFVTPGTAAYQAPPSMGFSRQEYWSGVPLPSNPRIIVAYNREGLFLLHSFHLSDTVRLQLLLLLLSRFSRVRLCTTLSTAAYQAPPSMGFSRQEYWSGLPFPSPGDLPDSGIEPGSPVLQADSLPAELPGKPPLVSRYAQIASGHPPWQA